jgi:hypothetical protein
MRPWTDDDDPAVRVKNGEASDICLRGIPIIPIGSQKVARDPDQIITVIRRIAGLKCRLTFSGGKDDCKQLMKKLSIKVIEDFSDEGQVVLEFP